MASRSVIMARSAFTDREKKNILIEEGNRRLRNCHPDLPWPRKAAFLTDMNLAMRQAGHTEKFRAMVTTRVVARYSMAMKNHRNKSKRMYRRKEERELYRKEQGGKATASDWMRKSGATTVINISATKGSKLALAIEQALASCPAPTGTRTKVQERPGRSVRETLVRGNPFPRPSCGRKSCPWVGRKEECKGRCYREGVGYLASCNICTNEQRAAGVEEDKVVHSVYVGESHRSLPFRLSRHFNEYRAMLRKGRRGRGGRGGRGGGRGGQGGGGGGRASSSWMWDHVSEVHDGQGNEEIHQDFNFFLTASFQKPLERQVDEMRRLDLVEKKGKATITVGGRKKDIKVQKESLNRKEERFNLGAGRIRADFGKPKQPQTPSPPSSHTIPPPPPPPPTPHPPPPPPSSPVLLPHLRPAPTTPAPLPTTQPHQSPTPAAAAARPINRAAAAALPLPLRRIAAQTSVSNSQTSVPNSPRRLRPRKERKTGD